LTGLRVSDTVTKYTSVNECQEENEIMRKKDEAGRLVVIGVRVEPRIRAALELEALGDRRSVSAVVHNILHRWLQTVIKSDKGRK
jgi:hypothetical protein